MNTPAQERQARSRAIRASTGGKQIAVMLTSAAAAQLAAHVAKGETIAGVVNRLLTGNAPSPMAREPSKADDLPW